MSYIKPLFRHPAAKKNKVGYAKADYEGRISTLCAGCGHDSISAAIVQACYEMNIEPHRVAKLSGIGCSSKTPTYFLSNSHGFNSVHGRMPSITTGAAMANKNLMYLGVSGDGDTASIGIGQFVHAIRRNINMLYIVMNNGCYGLTKGQDSATADYGSVSKAGSKNPFQSIDLVAMSLELGASFVGRSFSGDKSQLVPLIKAGLSHRGFAFVDIISPCVTFNNNKGSTKSYDYVREHIEVTSPLDFVPFQKEIAVSYPEGSAVEVTLHDGSTLKLEKLDSDWNPQDKLSASSRLLKAKHNNEILTGLIYIDNESEDLYHLLNCADRPLNKIPQEELNPGPDVLEKINASLR